MSSFIHSPKHFASAQVALQDLIIFRDMFYIPSGVTARFPDLDYMAKYREDKTRSIVGAVFDELISISVQTVSKQYAHIEEETAEDITLMAELLQAEKKQHERKLQLPNLKPVELYKALQSIRYQIEIDYIKRERSLTEAEDNAINFLNQIIETLAVYIISQLPEYNAAKTWCIE